jgi:hypothetical protein
MQTHVRKKVGKNINNKMELKRKKGQRRKEFRGKLISILTDIDVVALHTK